MKIQTAAEWRQENLGKAQEAIRRDSGGLWRGTGVTGSRVVTDKAGNTRKKATGGKRSDLGGLYVRSMWEANFARYMNFCMEQDLICLATGTKITSWEYEPQEFALTRVKGGEYKSGARFYKPDFKAHVLADSRTLNMYPKGYVWLEVKGFMDAESRVKLERFERCHPEEKFKLVMGRLMGDIKRFYALHIPTWEYAE